MQTTVARWRDIWENTSRSNQILLVSLVLGAIIAGVVFVYWAGTPDYAVLVYNASSSDSSAILERLKNQKIPYKIQDGTIEVPASMKDELRIQLAGAGLMNSGTLGYGLLDKAPFGQTQAMEQLTAKRALEGEMESAIKTLQQVATANVKYAAGDDSMFVNPEKKEPSASILVHLKPGQELNKVNRRAIVNLVSHAYTGLSSRNVTMMDGDGNLLWDGMQESGDTVGLDERQAEERAFKESLSHEIQSQIRAIVGPNKSGVIVRAELDFDKKNETRTEPLPGIVTNQQTDEESLKGQGQLNANRPGVGASSNTNGPTGSTNPTGQPQPNGVKIDSSDGNPPGQYTHNQSIKTTIPGSNKTETVKAPGEVKSLRVAVLLDNSVKPETVAAVEQTVQTIVGYDPAKPDPNRLVSVKQVEFDTRTAEADKKASDAAAASERTNRMLAYGVPVALMLLMLIILARGLKRISPNYTLALQSGPRGALAGAGPGGNLNLAIGDLPEGAISPDGAPNETVLGIGTGDQVHTFEVINPTFDADLQSIKHLANNRPETVAALIKSWMAEKGR